MWRRREHDGDRKYGSKRRRTVFERTFLDEFAQSVKEQITEFREVELRERKIRSKGGDKASRTKCAKRPMVYNRIPFRRGEPQIIYNNSGFSFPHMNRTHKVFQLRKIRARSSSNHYEWFWFVCAATAIIMFARKPYPISFVDMVSPASSQM